MFYSSLCKHGPARQNFGASASGVQLGRAGIVARRLVRVKITCPGLFLTFPRRLPVRGSGPVGDRISEVPLYYFYLDSRVVVFVMWQQCDDEQLHYHLSADMSVMRSYELSNCHCYFTRYSESVARRNTAMGSHRGIFSSESTFSSLFYSTKH